MMKTNEFRFYLAITSWARSLEQGDTSRNYHVREGAHVVGEVFPGCRVSFGASGQENRSYRVSFEKIRKPLPGFRCAWDAAAEQNNFMICSSGLT
jgi:hypothetical protein